MLPSDDDRSKRFYWDDDDIEIVNPGEDEPAPPAEPKEKTDG